MVLPWIACALACKDDAVRPATEIVVAVDSDLVVGSDLKRIEVEILDSDGDRKDHSTFDLVTSQTPKKGQANLPFSFGIAKSKANAFQVRVLGFGDDSNARVQRTLKATFQDGKSLLLVAFLAKVCVDNLCDDGQTCYYDATGGTAVGECGDVPEPGLNAVRGDGLAGANGRAETASAAGTGAPGTGAAGTGAPGTGSAGLSAAAGSGAAGASDGGAGAGAGAGGYGGYGGASGGTGATCTGCKSTENCVNGRCECATAPTTYYEDFDGDGHGDPKVPMSACGAAPKGYTTTKDDCCDSDSDAFPGQTMGFDTAVACDKGGYDFNCDGLEELGFPNLASGSCCLTWVDGWQGSVPDCGVLGVLTLCDTTACRPQTDYDYAQFCR